MMTMSSSSSRIRRLSQQSPAVTVPHSDNSDGRLKEGIEVGGMGISGDGGDVSTNPSSDGCGTTDAGAGGGMSGIDSFLHRLNNEVDLNNSSKSSSSNKLSRIKKKKKQQEQQQRLLPTSKTSNIHEDSSNNSCSSSRSSSSRCDHQAQNANAAATTTPSCASTITSSCSTLPSSLLSSFYPTTTNKKRILLSLLSFPLLYLLYDTMISPPQQRILHHYFHLITPVSTSSTTTAMMHKFLSWVQRHPTFGAIAFIFAYGLCVIFLLPGTPLTLGGGYVYKVSYGWIGGITMATFTTIAGSLFGSCTCFLLGRYILRSRIRIWGRKKYPFFDAMDGAISENGFKIMCLLYLTPILPLGPVSYMVGTTSMSIGKFAGAKVAAVPIVMMYCFIGASTDTFFGSGDNINGDDNNNLVEDSSRIGVERMVQEVGGINNYSVSGESGSVSDGIGGQKPIVNGMVESGGFASSSAAAGGGGVVDESTHRKMVLFGLILSFVSMSLVSHFVKKELYKIFDQQKRDKSDGDDDANDGNGRGVTTSSSSTIANCSNGMEDHIEMGSGVDRKNLLRRPRGGHQEGSGGIDLRLRYDEEKG